MQQHRCRGQGRIGRSLAQGIEGCIGPGEAAQQRLQRVGSGDLLQIGNQSQMAISLALPAELLAIRQLNPHGHGLPLIGKAVDRSACEGLEPQGLQRAPQGVGIPEDRWQDGKVGHQPRPALPNPNRDAAGIQWPLPPSQQPALPLRLGVMASGHGSNFEALVNACNDGQLAARVVQLIVNNPGCGATRRAERLGVPWRLLDHRGHASREALDQALVDCLQSRSVDVVVMAGWMRIVTPVLIQAFEGRLLNIHPSLLPSFKGMDAVGQALAAGVTLAGCTVHLVCEAVDAGEILMQAAVPVMADDDHASLSSRIQQQEHRLLPAAVALLAQRLDHHQG